MKRSELAINDTWDLSIMYANQQAYDQDMKKALQLLDNLTAYEGKIAQDKAIFQQFLDQEEELSQMMGKLYIYPKMFTDVEPDNVVAQKLFAQAIALFQKANQALTYVPLEIIRNKDMIEQWLKDEDLRDYRYPIYEIFRTIPHRLDDATETLMAKVDELTRIGEDTYESFRPEFKEVIIDGQPAFLNQGTFHQFLLHKDVNVRKQAYDQYYEEYKRYQNVFYNLLTGHAKGQILKAQVHKFDSAIQASLFEDEVEESLFRKILLMTNVTYRPYLHEYFLMRKQTLKLDEQHPYDIHIPLVQGMQITYTVNESFAILKKAFQPLGDDYVAMMDVARNERWIDFMPCVGKQGGAYSSGTHIPHPFILINFTGEYNSLSTLAHELGHAMHSYYTLKHNRPMLSHYRIFVAEVASTVNELLLNEYLMKHSKSKDEKAYLLDNLMMQLVGTIYRQPMYAQFEVSIHEALEKGEALSSQDITDLCMKHYQDYYGEGVCVDDLQRYSCYAIPHYYYNFYVYKYTLGMAVAISFVRRILHGDVEPYRLFLTKGGSESPIDELIHSGVDPREDSVYDDAFTYFKELLDEFQTIMND